MISKQNKFSKKLLPKRIEPGTSCVLVFYSNAFLTELIQQAVTEGNLTSLTLFVFPKYIVPIVRHVILISLQKADRSIK